jgi:hypothetical protein
LADGRGQIKETAVTDFFRTYGRLLMLNGDSFEGLRQSKDGVLFAFKLFVMVGLIAGIGTLSGARELLQTPTVAERAYQVAEDVSTWSGQLEGFVGRVAAGPALSVTQWFTDLGATLESFAPPLGVQTSRVIRLIGEWLTTPLTLLAAWMAAILPVLLVAKLMGAGGSLRALVVLLLVSAAPQVLTVLGSFPLPEASAWSAAASVLQFVALFWGLAILVKGLSVAGEVDQRKAITIVAVTALVFYILIPSIVLTIGGLKTWGLIQLLG